jgi:hypothetical protein
MYDKLGDGADNEYYYQCADLALRRGVSTAGGSSTSVGTTTAAGADAGSKEGCACTQVGKLHPSVRTLPALVLLAGSLLWRRAAKPAIG